MLFKIIFLCSFLNFGDVAHKEALKKTFQAACSTQNTVLFFDLDANVQPELLEATYQELIADHSVRSVVIAVGETSLIPLRILQQKTIQHPLSIVSVHQWFDSLKDLKIDRLAIPKRAVQQNQVCQEYLVQTKPIYLFSVPCSNPTRKELCDSYEKWAYKNKPKFGEKYIVVTLPGDAPDEQNKQKLFSQASAEELVNAVVKLWKDLGSVHTILVQNSPCTGKFNKLGNVTNDHKKQKNTQRMPALDAISFYVNKALFTARVPFEFFNFLFDVEQFEKDGKREEKIVGNNSVFNQLLHLACGHSENRYIVPAESVSMIGQIPYYLSAKNIIYFRPDSMNAVHENLLEEVLQKPYGSCFLSDGSVQPLLGESYGCRFSTDADIIVSSVMKHLVSY